MPYYGSLNWGGGGGGGGGGVEVEGGSTTKAKWIYFKGKQLYNYDFGLPSVLGTTLEGSELLSLIVYHQSLR